jgi:rhamnogalacturonyl hydrolase YesR
MKCKTKSLFAAAICGFVLTLLNASAATAPDADAVKAITQKVADWQIRTFDESIKYRAISSGRQKQLLEGAIQPEVYHKTDWHFGVLYVGYDQWRKVADQPAKYTAFLKDTLEPYEWRLYGKEIYTNIYHADTHLVGLVYQSLYGELKDPAMIAPLRETFDEILANPSVGPLTYQPEKSPNDHRHRWGWCDALFMGPPVWARLTKLTGEKKYLEFMDREYQLAYETLWDDKAKLFYRDTRFFTRSENNSKPVFWSRGNGWVLAGLALMIPDLPPEWPRRSFYVDRFQDMAGSLKNLQREDGTWNMGLLADEADYPVKETSGTALIAYGLAWGVNNGLLDRATYEPVIFRAWNALTESVTDEGMLGYVQPVGASPGDSYPDKTDVFGIGAFLLAGAEIYQLAAGDGSKNLLKTSGYTPEPTLFMKDGGWCWFQDPRAMVHDGKLFIGSVKGNGSGPALVGIYDLEKGKPLGNVLMQDNFDRDDHNSPVFHVRPDGSVLATYAKHGKDTFHYSRISDPSDPMKWGEEFKHERTSPNPKDQVTYMNLIELKDEGLLYNFYRSINYNPTFVTSKDHGLTWSEPVHFVQNEVGGRHRPYARYVGDGANTIHVTISDAHPRDFGNNLSYFAFRGGNFYRADGMLIKNLAKEGPLRPSEADKIYQGSGLESQGKQQSAPNAAWPSSIALDANGYPHVAYSVHHTRTDLLYRVASWNGTQWIDREVAHAGKCLQPDETSYTGLITFDESDPTRVIISSDVDPSTGEYLWGTHEIYTAKVGEKDSIPTIEWTAVTAGSKHPNLRPVLVAGDGYKLALWLSGPWRSYIDYDVDVKGLVLESPDRTILETGRK